MTEPGENTDEPLENMAEPPKEEWIRPTGKRSFVWDHFKENNDRTKFKCDYCNKTFKNNNGTIAPAANHLKKMHYITHYKDSNQGTLVNGLAKCKLSSTNGKFENEGKCQLCNFTGKDLKRHVMAVHAKIKDHVCNVCGRSFSWKEALNRHLSLVHLEKSVKGLNDQLSYECETCGSSFTTKPNLCAHKKTIHLKIKDYRCRDCGASFYKSSHLNMHQKSVHLKIKDHECGTCGKMFGRRYALIKHEKSAHIKIKDHKCEVCEMAFYDISELNRHYKAIHLRAHVCKACRASFRNRQTLTEHELADHLNITAYECKECDKAYPSKDGLRMHLKSNHNKTENNLGNREVHTVNILN